MNPLAALLVVWWWIGDRIVARAWPGELPTSLRLALGWCTGAALAGSLLLFGRRFDFGDSGIAIGQAMVALAIGVVCRFVPESVSRPDVAASRLSRVLCLAVLAAVSMAMIALIAEVANRPIGGIDAPAMWHARARYLATADQDWLGRAAAIETTPHPYYPLLFPAIAAHLVPGDAFVLWPSGLFAVVQFAVLLLMTQGMVQSFAGSPAAALATLMLCVNSRVYKVCAEQFADILVTLFVTAGMVCVCRVIAVRQRATALLALAGFLLAAAASIKNEGLGVVLGLLLTLVGGGLLRGKLSLVLRQSVPAVVVGVPVFLLLAACNPARGARGEFASTSLVDKVTLIASLERHWAVIQEMGREVLAFGGGVLFWAPLLFWWSSPGRAGGDAGVRLLLSRLLLALTGIMVVVYFGTYLVTPNDLHWHVVVSCSRLLTQLFPLFLLGLALRRWDREGSEAALGP